MSKRSPKSVEEKLEIISKVLHKNHSIAKVCRVYNVHESTVHSWIWKYQRYGLEGLKESRTWKRYPADLKYQAVKDYLDGKDTLSSICRKYEISDNSVLKRWVNQYTSSNKLTTTGKGLGKKKMNQGRKTSYEERIEIAKFTIEHGDDYQAAIDKYNVSYQQVYSWVRKYKKEGSLGLLDRRGQSLKSKPNLSVEEELKLKIKQLEEKNELLEMENGLLKKLEEIKRRHGL